MSNEKKIPISLMAKGSKVFGDTEDNDVEMVVIGFKDKNQLTFVKEEANTFLLHYFNGLQIREASGINVPEPVEWGEVKRIQ